MKTIIKGLAFCVAICCFAMAATNVATTAAINGKVEMVQTARDNIQIPDAAQCVQTSSMSMNRIGAGINIAFVGEKKSDQMISEESKI